MHVGYVVKRFPRVSETFIAQEILELERQGVEVTVMVLRPTDQVADHAWLEELKAPVVRCHDLGLSEAWRRLHRGTRRDDRFRQAAQSAITAAFAFPSNRGKRCLSSATAIREAVAARRIDHLHAHFANQPAFVAHLAHLLTGSSYSFTGHAKDLYADPLPNGLLRELVASAAFTVTVSDDNCRQLATRVGPELHRKIVRIYNGVKVPSAPSEPPSEGPARLLCVARLVEKKGITTLLRTMAALPREPGLDEARLEIIGDGPLREPLRALAVELEVDDRVEWLGTQPHEEVVARMRRASLFVLPCRVAADGDRDALPTVLLEAMAEGVACVSTHVGGVPEIIEDGVTGVVVPQQDPERLAVVVAELLRSPQLRRQMGRAGHRRAARLFERRANVEALRRCFESAVAGGQPGDDRYVTEAVS